MTTKTYTSYIKYKLVGGEVRVSEVTKKYTVSNAYVLPDETKAEIFRKWEAGIPATRIAKDIGIGVWRVRRLIKKATAGTEVGGAEAEEGAEEQKNDQ